MGRSEMKTTDFVYARYFEVSQVKVSARSDQTKGGSYVTPLNAVHENLVLRSIFRYREMLKGRWRVTLNIMIENKSNVSTNFTCLHRW